MSLVLVFLLLLGQSGQTPVASYAGVTVVTRTETSPRAIRMHVARVDLSTPGLRVALTGPAGALEVVRQTTAEHVRAAGAQLGVNAHFFLPFPSADPEANLIGIAASDGKVFSAFESPTQNYALVTDAAGINIDRGNHASLVRRDPAAADGTRALGAAKLWTTVSGSAADRHGRSCDDSAVP